MIANKLDVLAARMARLEKSRGASTSPDIKPLPPSRTDTPLVEFPEKESPERREVSPNTDDVRQPVEAVNMDSPNSFDEHTTAAHKLIILWPSVHRLLEDAAPMSNYVIEGEARGPLRLYGYGEADESGNNGAFGATSPAHSDESPATPPDTWGPGQLPYDIRRSEPFASTGMTPEGEMDLSKMTIKRLFESYKKHMHRLHPFLDLNSLGRFIESFTRKYRSDPSVLSPFIGNNNGTVDGNVARSNKRKRSEPNPSVSGSANDNSSRSQSHVLRNAAPERTLSNAIVYLVLALGKVCEHKEPLPGPLQDDTKVHHMAPPMLHQGYSSASPAGGNPSPPSPHSGSFGSTPDGGESMRPGAHSRRSSYDGSPGATNKGPPNVQKIPGLIYYRAACSILGDFSDSNELGCAQARLLAGLYKGQLARVQESWSWIHDASRTCRYRIKL